MSSDNKSPDAQAAELQHLDKQVAEAREALAVATKSAIAFVKERPVTSIVGAVAAGYLLGRLVRR